MTKTMINDMTEGPVLSSLAKFAIPVMLANVLQAVYSMVDMIVVGQVVGATGLSAVGIGGQLLNILLSIGMGFSYGGQVLISQQVGAKNETIHTTIGTLFFMEALLAIVFGVLGAFGHKLLLGLMNTPPEALADATGYTLICCCGLLFIYGYNAVCSILRGMGESKLPMYFIAIASVVNLILDVVFVAGLGWSAAGAALATVIAQAVAFGSALGYLIRHKEAFNFDFKLKSFKPDMSRVAALSRLGVPYIFQSIMITGSMMFVNSQVNAYGLVASAVDSVGGKLNSVVNIISGAISVSSATMMAQCFGARKFDRMKKCFNACMIICMTWWVIISAAYLIAPKGIFSLFSDDAGVLEMAPSYLRIAVVWVLSMCSMCAPFALVEGIGYASFNLIVGVLDGVFARIGLAILLGHFFDLPGFWMGSALAGFVTTIMMGVYYLTGRWKKREVLVK